MKIFKKLLLFLFVNLCLDTQLVNASNEDERKPYIVYMGELPEGRTSLEDEHHHLLSEAIGDERLAREHKIHSYGRSFNGFVARLLPHEANILSEKEGVVSVFPNTLQKLHTTRSWDFLGMAERMAKRDHKVESNLIIGLLDTGIWIESPSFNDKGYGPPPPKWKGKCAKAGNFTGCNNKVIGARYYNVDNTEPNPSPADTDGHGTHTSSTAAGIPVAGASLYGLAKGTARGGVPAARLAAYKVCWGNGCEDMDILAGFDEAIADGVDILSVSLGGPSRNFFEDPMAIGTFHAMKKGILTSCSGGNEGPYLFTVGNVAPWIMTVAASSIDRQFETEVKLGNGMKTTGISINTFSPKKQMYPLTNGAVAANKSAESYGNASACDYGTLMESKVKGKIVYCIGVDGQDTTIDGYGGVGTIMSIDEDTDVAFPFVIPATFINAKDGKKIDQYIKSTKTAKAVIYKSKGVTMTAPFITSFSSRGPQLVSLNILKPDVAAPGLSILAAYSQLTTLTGDPEFDKRVVKYNIISGTSMSCPHVAGAAAYVKSFHPNWSPAAIKSALMTTATPMKIKPLEGELASGSGQINPTKAINPGLIYDINVTSYISFLCKEGYNSTTIALLMGGKKRYNCSSFRPARGTDGLNYPSMHIQMQNPNSSISAVFYRTVTNMGDEKSVYKAKVISPKGLKVEVVPKILVFDRLHQTSSFKVVVKGKFSHDKDWMLSAFLVWSDSKHAVKSPIIIYRSIFYAMFGRTNSMPWIYN